MDNKGILTCGVCGHASYMPVEGVGAPGLHSYILIHGFYDPKVGWKAQYGYPPVKRPFRAMEGELEVRYEFIRKLRSSAFH